MLTTLSNVARLYTGISHTLCISSPKRVDYSKLCVLLNFYPNISWHFATLLYHQSRNNLVERGETQNLSQLEVGNIFVSKCPALGLFAICWLVKLSQATWDTAEGWLSKPATWFCSSLSQWTQPVSHWGPTYPGPSFAMTCLCSAWAVCHLCGVNLFSLTKYRFSKMKCKTRNMFGVLSMTQFVLRGWTGTPVWLILKVIFLPRD